MVSEQECTFDNPSVATPPINNINHVPTNLSTIIEAIAAGQRAAAAIDKYFDGEKLQWHFKSVRPKRLIKEIDVPDEEMEKLKREKMPCLKIKNRIKNFEEVELGLSEETCVNDAKRCLRCDL